ncbi:MAG: PAS domain-containing protein [Rudaea sp.]|uniref:PAS domain-containing protein n=1 Tax=Rudaea sp. TaxID=2136325 RepID=UPI0039E368D0
MLGRGGRPVRSPCRSGPEHRRGGPDCCRKNRGRKRICVKVNSGFLEMSGYKRDAVLAASIYQIDVLEGTPNRDETVAKLQRGEPITQTEAVLRLPGDARKFVIVAGQPIEVGEEACMLFTFIDLSARKKAEDALRQSEERFSKAFRLAPVPMALCRLPDFDFVETNEAFRQVSAVLARRERTRISAIANSKPDCTRLRAKTSPPAKACATAKSCCTARTMRGSIASCRPKPWRSATKAMRFAWSRT